MVLAEQMVSALAFAGCDVAKFQKRTLSLMPEELKNKPYDNPNSFGKTYYEHRKILEFSMDEHKQLVTMCKKYGIGYSCSVWDKQAARDIARGINPALIKVPSAANTNFDMIQWLCTKYSGEVHISLGMTTKEEKEAIYDFIKRTGQAYRVVVYLCTSAYPCTFADVYLKDLEMLFDWRKHLGLKGVGYSGHHLGIALDIAVATMGVTHIERHFTLDRTMKGTDHAASLEPDGLRKLVRNLGALDEAMKKSDYGLRAVEKSNREKLKCGQ